MTSDNDDRTRRNVANVLTGAILVAVTSVVIGFILALGWRAVSWVGGF